MQLIYQYQQDLQKFSNREWTCFSFTTNIFFFDNTLTHIILMKTLDC